MPASPSAQATPKRGGTAVVGVSVAGATLNTQLTSTVTALIIADLWASGLFKYDRNGDKKPQIASSWDISKDGKSYTFHLRPNLKWSDGHPFSSEDVAFTLNAFAKYNTYLVKVLPNIDRTETPDANTFVVHLKEPQSAALEGFDKEVFPLMPKHIYDGKDIPSNEANRAPVGLGPFKFVKWEEGRGITFTRNEHYWDQPKPYLDSVVAVFIPNVQQQMNALYRGEVDVLRPALPQVGRAIEQAKAKNAFEVREVKVNAAERLSLDVNTSRETFNKPLVRQALLMAIDRERISKDVYQGLAFPAMNAIPEQFTMLTDPSVDYNKQFAYDPAKAGKMLDEAGFPLKDGKRFTHGFHRRDQCRCLLCRAVRPDHRRELARHRHRREIEPDRGPALDQQGLQGAQLRRLDGLADGAHRPAVRRRSLLPLQHHERAVRQSDRLLQSRARCDRGQGGRGAAGRAPAMVQAV